jgi:hypothetical protein
VPEKYITGTALDRPDVVPLEGFEHALILFAFPDLFAGAWTENKVPWQFRVQRDRHES